MPQSGNLQRKSNFGPQAEDFAVKKLQELGYVITARNFRSRFGEIDIVAVKNNILVFIEVKARTGSLFGAPEEAVTRTKLQKIQKTALFYCNKYPRAPREQRIEVFSIENRPGNDLRFRIIEVY